MAPDCIAAIVMRGREGGWYNIALNEIDDYAKLASTGTLRSNLASVNPIDFHPDYEEDSGNPPDVMFELFANADSERVLIRGPSY